MPTTYADFIDALEALAITGVVKTFQGPPASLDTADLPARWVQMPKGKEPLLTFQTAGGWPTLTADLVVAIGPNAQDTQAANFAAQVTMLDAVAAALRGADLTKAKHTWEIRAGGVKVAGVAYWAVIATVTGKG